MQVIHEITELLCNESHLLWWWAFTKFCHETHVLLVHLVPSCRWTTAPLLLPIPCASCLAVPCCMAHTPASPAHHVVRHVGLVLALPCLVVRGAAVGALGHPVLPQGPIQQGELPQLHLPQLVTALGNLDPLLDHFPGRRLVGNEEEANKIDLILLTALLTESASGAVT